jgi:hypothetical protein
VLVEGDLAALRGNLPGPVFRLMSSRRRDVQKALAALAPLDLFAEGDLLRVRFPAQEPAPLLARLAALPGVEQVRQVEASLEDVFLHALSEGGGHA